MADVVYSILLIAVGGLNLFYAVKFLINPQFAKNCIELSPKAWILRKIFGIEKATKITKSIFVSLGIILGIVFIVLGIVLFIL